MFEPPTARMVKHGAALRDEHWTLIIEPKGRWMDLKLSELWTYRDLIVLLVRRDFVALYKQTILGPLWYLVQPLLTTITFTIIFGSIASLPTDGLPKFLFYMSGIVLWSYFSSSLTKTSNTFVANAGLFGKVYFPRLAVPISILISNLVSFAVQMVFFLCFLLYFSFTGAALRPNLWIAFTPILLLMMAGLGLALGIIVSSLTTRYRDLANLVGFGVQLLMYATPVIYPLSLIPERFRWLVLANPITPIVETFRFAFLGTGTLSLGHLAYSGAATGLILIAGLLMFTRIERTFIDTV